MGAELTVADRILTALAKSQKIDVRTIKRQHSLQHDLGLNSADAIDLVFALEDMFSIEVPDEDFRKFTTVSEVIQYVEGRLQAT
jgi:acyl carrier protein